jgi:hypothetical protein
VETPRSHQEPLWFSSSLLRSLRTLRVIVFSKNQWSFDLQFPYPCYLCRVVTGLLNVASFGHLIQRRTVIHFGIASSGLRRHNLVFPEHPRKPPPDPDRTDLEGQSTREVSKEIVLAARESLVIGEGSSMQVSIYAKSLKYLDQLTLQATICKFAS